MRKIGDIASSAFEIQYVLVEERVEFADKRRDFAWLRVGYPLSLPSADALRVLGQQRQRS
jgi:hypothetical protein